MHFCLGSLRSPGGLPSLPPSTPLVPVAGLAPLRFLREEPRGGEAGPGKLLIAFAGETAPGRGGGIKGPPEEGGGSPKATLGFNERGRWLERPGVAGETRVTSRRLKVERTRGRGGGRSSDS